MKMILIAAAVASIASTASYAKSEAQCESEWSSVAKDSRGFGLLRTYNLSGKPIDAYFPKYQWVRFCMDPS